MKSMQYILPAFTATGQKCSAQIPDGHTPTCEQTLDADHS